MDAEGDKGPKKPGADFNEWDEHHSDPNSSSSGGSAWW
jgi:hypothetical protein